MRISINRKGGFAGTNDSAFVDTSTLSSYEADHIHSLVEEAGFFDLPANIEGPLFPDMYSYTITIATDNKMHVVSFRDGAFGVPGALRKLVEKLSDNLMPVGVSPVELEPVSAVTAYQREKVIGAHVISLYGTLVGKVYLLLDGNECEVDRFGLPTSCQKRLYHPIEVETKEMPEADPAKKGRRLYEILGHPADEYRLFLVVPGPAELHYRLVIEDQNDETSRRLITMEART